MKKTVSLSVAYIYTYIYFFQGTLSSQVTSFYVCRCCMCITYIVPLSKACLVLRVSHMYMFMLTYVRNINRNTCACRQLLLSYMYIHTMCTYLTLQVHSYATSTNILYLLIDLRNSTLINPIVVFIFYFYLLNLDYLIEKIFHRRRTSNLVP